MTLLEWDGAAVPGSDKLVEEWWLG